MDTVSFTPNLMELKLRNRFAPRAKKVVPCSFRSKFPAFLISDLSIFNVMLDASLCSCHFVGNTWQHFFFDVL